MEATIREGQAPVAVVSLGAGEQLKAEAGAMMFMTGDVSMDVEMTGGVTGALKRAVSGESVFLTTFTARGAGAVGLVGPYPGSIRQVDLDGELLCERSAYMGHFGDLEIEPVLSAKRGMGIVGGGEGLVLQSLKGKATVWIHAGGDFLDFDLAPEQQLVVDTGCMVTVEPTVKYEVKMQQGIGKALAGGEGLFLVHMTGPGHVTLQTLPFTRVAKQLGEGGGEAGGIVGSLLGR